MAFRGGLNGSDFGSFLNMISQMQQQQSTPQARPPQTWWTAVGDDPDLEFVKNAIKTGQNVNERSNEESTTNMTALHMAVLNGNSEIVDELLKYKAEVNVKDGIGLTPLHHASMTGDFDSARLLLKAGANVNADSVRQTPLHLATKLNQGGVALAALLISNGGNVSTDAKRTQPLELALESGNTSVAALLIHKGATKSQQKNEDEETAAKIEEQYKEAHELAELVMSPEGFSSLDGDNDGFIVEADLEDSGAPMEAISELFPLADLNSDGKLDKEEYAIFSLILSELMQGIDNDIDGGFGDFNMSDIMESLAMNDEEDPFMAFGGGVPFMGRGARGRQEEVSEEKSGPFIEEVDDEVD
jgi:hypothetical protein